MTSSSASCIPLISTSTASRIALKSIKYSRGMVSPPEEESTTATMRNLSKEQDDEID